MTSKSQKTDQPYVGGDAPAADKRGGGDALSTAEGVELEVPQEESRLLGEADHPVQAPQDGARVEAVWKRGWRRMSKCGHGSNVPSALCLLRLMGTIVSSGQLGALIYDVRVGERVHDSQEKDKRKISRLEKLRL